MKIETQSRDDCQLTVHVEVESERFETAIRRAARSLSERVKIPGFRPGKAPYNMVVQHVGEETIREEALDALVDEIYPAVIEELGLHPHYPGSLTDIEEGEPLQLTFVIPLQPQVSLGDYRSVRVPYDWQPPSSEEVDLLLRDLQIQHGKPRAVTENRPVQVDDLVLLGIALRQAEAAPEEPPLLDGTPIVQVREDDKDPDEMPFPGFSAQLVGMRKDERKTILHRYPDDHDDKMIRGKNIAHDVEVQGILVLELPELNDQFAQQVGTFETMEALRQEVATILRQYSKAMYESEYALRVLDEIRKDATVTYPPQMLEERVEALLEDVKEDLEERGLDVDTYLRSREMTLDEFIEKEIQPRARIAVERNLVTKEIGKREHLEVTTEDIESFLQDMLDEWFEAKRQSSGRRKPPQPSAQEMDRMVAFSTYKARIKVIMERLAAIGRGEAPELTEESATTNAPSAENAASADKAQAESAAASAIEE